MLLVFHHMSIMIGLLQCLCRMQKEQEAGKDILILNGLIIKCRNIVLYLISVMIGKRIPSGFLLMCWLDSLGYEIEVKKRDS